MSRMFGDMKTRMVNYTTCMLQARVSHYQVLIAGMLLQFRTVPHGGTMKARLCHLSPILMSSRSIVEDLTALYGQMHEVTDQVWTTCNGIVTYLANHCLNLTLKEMLKLVMELLKEAHNAIPLDYSAIIQTNRHDQMIELSVVA
jgi:hypothetical protein